MVNVVDSGTKAMSDPRNQFQFLVEFRGGMEFDVHGFDHQHESRFLKFFVGYTETAKHFYATAFEVVEVLGIVDSALPVDFTISNSNRSKVLGLKSFDLRFIRNWHVMKLSRGICLTMVFYTNLN